MRSNRSMPAATVIPELAYADITSAGDWLCNAFGFTIRLRIASHRLQLNAGTGAIVLTTGAGDKPADAAHSIMVRVEDVERHHQRAAERGARILRVPTTYPYGERQYTAVDPGGHVWTFSESVDDVNPSDWGGTPVDLT
jgi:uncharacterized glyoxalase superfamily protein PhnB